MSDRLHPPTDSTRPVRRCVVCRDQAPKFDLVRVARLPDGGVVISRDADGRGAYIHRRRECLEAAASRPKHLGRSLRCPPPADVLTSLPDLVHSFA